jgi:hypothetical protein
MTASRLPLTLLVVAIVLGLVGDLLLDVRQAHAGVTLWLLAILATTMVLLPRGPAEHTDGTARTGDARWRNIAMVIMAIAALLISWRSAEQLQAFAVLAFAGAGGIAMWSARGSIRGARLWEMVLSGTRTAMTFASGAVQLAIDAFGGTSGGARRAVPMFAIGTIAALPLLAITTALLADADPVFARGVAAIGDFLAEDFVAHVFRTGVFAWILAGWLHGVLRPAADPAVSPKAPTFQIAVHSPALIGFTALLAAYLGVQARALFGGRDYVMNTAGVSFASYARGGFFELVAVSALAMVLLLIVDATLDRTDERAERRFASYGWGIIALVGVLALSAANRLALYIGTFGWTTDRFYALAALVAIVGMLAWFGATVLRRQTSGFLPGVVTGAAVWVLALHVLNPDAFVARRNLERAVAGAEFDVPYHTALSEDAMPALLEGAPQLPAAQCEEVVRVVRATVDLRAMTQDGLRSWTASIAQARRAVAEPTLASAPCGARSPGN